MWKFSKLFALPALAVICLSLASVAAPADETDNSWVEESNKNARLVLDLLASFGPEGAASLGVDGLDEEIFDLKAGVYERSRTATSKVLKELHARLEKEQHPLVRQDLQILIKAGEDNLRSGELNRRYLLPYYNMTQTVFGGMRSLLDPQVDKARYPAAIVRLRKYAGLEKGYQPIVELAKARTKERFKVDGLQGPYEGEVVQDLERAPTFISGIKELFENTDLQGWQEPYEAIVSQLNDYNEWVRAEILPRARDDFRLPPALYEDALRNWGVDASPEDLIEQATKGYMDIRNEMVALAPLVAAEKGYDTKTIAKSSAD